MAGGGRVSAPWQDEFLEHGEVFIESVEVCFESVNEILSNRAVTGDAQFTTELEKVVLNLSQTGANIVRNGARRQHDADHAVRFVDSSESFHPNGVFRDATAIAEARGAIVAGACDYFAKPISHIETIGRRVRTVKKPRLFLLTLAAIVMPSVSNTGIAEYSGKFQRRKCVGLP